MFISVMQKNLSTKTTQERVKEPVAPTINLSERPTTKLDSRNREPILSSKPVSTGKGKALKNPRQAAVEVEPSDASDSSDWEDEEEDEGPKKKPRAIAIAFEVRIFKIIFQQGIKLNFLSLFFFFFNL
jgi:hypothetical protein